MSRLEQQLAAIEAKAAAVLGPRCEICEDREWWVAIDDAPLPPTVCAGCGRRSRVVHIVGDEGDEDDPLLARDGQGG